MLEALNSFGSFVILVASEIPLMCNDALQNSSRFVLQGYIEREGFL